MAPQPRRDRQLAGRRGRAPDDAILRFREDLELRFGEAPLPSGVEVSTATVGQLRAARVSPLERRLPGLLVHLHGGAFVGGSPRVAAAAIARIAASASCEALLVEYPLAPEDPFPNALLAVLNGYAALLDQVPSGQVILGGDSAGANLVTSAITLGRERGLPPPAGAFLLSPWLDLTLASAAWSADDRARRREAMALHADRYLQGVSPEEPLASPVFADLRGLPPLLIHVGGRDPLREDGERLALRAREAGIEVDYSCWQHADHAWEFFFPDSKETRESIRALTRWLTSRLETASIDGRRLA